jgi:hypothetical protein
MSSDDAAAECRMLVTAYLRYAIENARSALTLMHEPATTESAINLVCETLAQLSIDH